MKKLYTLFFPLISLLVEAPAQVQRAFLNEDYTITVESSPEIDPPLNARGEGFSQMVGFPKGARANKTLKNLRNVTLVDLNRDGADDIIWGANSRLFADGYDKRLWIRTLSGIVIYPASVADLNKDGKLEIVQPTGGSQTDSRLYLLNANGEDLPGWPLNFDGHWILTSAALSDVNDDGGLEVIFNERDSPESRIHIVGIDGRPFNDKWPVSLFGTPALTPSIGDVDADGAKEIYLASTTARYLFDLQGKPEMGWPLSTHPSQRYSYQSAILVDLNEDGDLEIVGATHGNQPEFYVLQADNTYLSPWPKPVPGNSWTYSTPTVIKIDGQYCVLMSRPIDEYTSDMLYHWNAQGRSINNFPLYQSGGLEGFISVADVDGDAEFELVFGSNLLLNDGRSFIHAYNLNDLSEVPGFPIRPRGWTYMNGINIGDVNGDGRMDLVSLTYTQDPNPNAIDSIYLNVYELNVPYSPERVLWGTYKGNNTRDGLLSPANLTPVREAPANPPPALSLSPNPVMDMLHLSLQTTTPSVIQMDLYNAHGQHLATLQQGPVERGVMQWNFPVNHLPPGMYCISVRLDRQSAQTLKFVKN